MSDYLANSGFTGCLGCAGLAIGSTPAGVSTAALSGAGLYFAIDGIAGYKVDDATATITAAVAQVADSVCMYLIVVDSAGTIYSVKGEDVLTVDIGVNGSAQLPGVPNDRCPIGAFKMTTVAVTFTAATTDLDASGCTAAYYDYAGGIPSSPQTS